MPGLSDDRIFYSKSLEQALHKPEAMTRRPTEGQKLQMAFRKFADNPASSHTWVSRNVIQPSGACQSLCGDLHTDTRFPEVDFGLWVMSNVMNKYEIEVLVLTWCQEV